MPRLKLLLAIVVSGIFSVPAVAHALETETLTNIVQINEDGFGTDANKYAFSMAVYDDALYVGTLNLRRMPGMARFFSATTARKATEGAEIWRYDGESGWRKVADAAELSDYRNLGVRKMYVAKGCLYGVTANHDEGMEIWRTCNGEDWEVVADKGLGNPKNTSGRGLGFFKGYIYAGAENRSEGAQLWRSPDGLEWEKVADKGGGDGGNVWFSDFAEFDDCLYMGTLNYTGMQMFRTCDGVTLDKIYEGGLEKWTNTAGMKLVVYDDMLYVSTMDFFRGFDLYRSADGLSFDRILQKGFTKRGNAYLWQMEEYNGRLYAGTYNHKLTLLPTGTFTLYSSEDGENWIVENDDAFGNPWYYGVRSMAVYDDKLIIGTASAQYGCKVFEAVGK